MPRVHQGTFERPNAWRPSQHPAAPDFWKSNSFSVFQPSTLEIKTFQIFGLHDVHLGTDHNCKKNLPFIGISTYFAIKNKNIPSRELTYPTWAKGKSSSKVPLEWDMLVPWRVFLRWSGFQKQILSNALGLCQSAMQLGIFRSMTRPEVSGLCFDLRCSLDILKITSKKGWSSRYLGRAFFANFPPQVDSMEKRKEPSLKHAWIYIKSS